MHSRRLVLMASYTVTLTVAASLAWAADPQRNTSTQELEKQLQVVLDERLATAEEALAALQASFDVGAVTYLDLLPAEKRLLKARLALTTTAAQEIEALEHYLEAAQSAEQFVKVQFDSGTGGKMVWDYMAAKEDRQKAEIALIKARLKAKRG